MKTVGRVLFLSLVDLLKQFNLLSSMSSVIFFKSACLAFAIGLAIPGCANESLENKSLKDIHVPREEQIQLQSDGLYSTNPSVNIYLNTIFEDLNYDMSKLTSDHTQTLKEFKNYIGMDDQGKIMGFTCRTNAIHLGQMVEQITIYAEIKISAKSHERSQLYQSRADIFYLAIRDTIVNDLPNGLPWTDLTK